MAKRARREGPTKSQVIREYMTNNRKDGPQAVAAAVNAAHGWKVTPQFVSTIKSNDKRKKKKRGRKAGADAAPAMKKSGGEKFSMDSLIAAKQFAIKMGGIDKAKSAMESLARLLG
jgi:hypothetical protein